MSQLADIQDSKGKGTEVIKHILSDVKCRLCGGVYPYTKERCPAWGTVR